MKLMILIIVMVLERFWTKLDDWHANRAVEHRVLALRAKLAKFLGNSFLGSTLALVLVWIGLPLVAAWLFTALDHSMLGVLIDFVLSILLLLLLLAPRQMHRQVNRLRTACLGEDAETAAQCRAQLTEGAALNAQTPLPQQLAERIITLGYQEWFAVLFWFVLLGPAAALFYRLTDWLAHDANRAADGFDGSSNPPQQLLGLLDWPVVRIYAALLLLAGGFNRGLDAWLNGEDSPESSQLSSLAQKNANLIGRVGHAALELVHEDDCGDAEMCLADQSRWFKNAWAIVLRALLIGLGVVALFTLSGWLR